MLENRYRKTPNPMENTLSTIPKLCVLCLQQRNIQKSGPPKVLITIHC